MITDTLVNLSAAAILALGQLVSPAISENILSSREMSLEKRYYPVQKENILLNMAYMDGRVTKKEDINWDLINKPFTYAFVLEPGKTFAFHDDVLDQYKDSLIKTTQAHFNSQEGFKSSGYLFGDGVCHLASLIYWVAKDAGLEVNAPTNHDFMAIPEISKEYGVSIYNNPFSKGSNAWQNLYITNNKEKAITFKFDYDGTNLKVSAVEVN